MRKTDPWLLPEGVEDLVPNEAWHLEKVRRRIIDLFFTWGYDLVSPPLIEYLDSLLIGSGHDLDSQTFKVTDQLSGRLLGIRADMTPQVARMDAHTLKRDKPTRLCYFGTVLHAVGDPLEKSRCPIQIGAELYGDSGIESDLEVIRLMLEVLAITGILDVHLDIGHVGIFRELSKQSQLDAHQESELFEVLQKKAKPEYIDKIKSLDIAQRQKAMFISLLELNGDKSIIKEAQDLFSDTNTKVKQAISDLTYVSQTLSKLFPALEVSFDLAELRGYHYHTGLVFSTFVPSSGREITRGGRYDNLGSIFGRKRPATGFSADLKVLSSLSFASREPMREPILAPDEDDDSLRKKVQTLRQDGEVVINQLPSQSMDATKSGCAGILEKHGNEWVIIPNK